MGSGYNICEVVEMSRARVNGIDIYYELHGEGAPLVMIMGLRRNIEWWYRQIPVLGRHYQLLVFDNRGAGRSDKPEMEYSIRMFAEDTAALMDQLGVGRAPVLGYSMGGYIAQELAINYPEKVQGLILAATSAGGESAVKMDPERQKEFEDVVGLTPQQVLEKNSDIYFSPDFIETHPDEVAEFIRVSLRHPQPDDAFLRQYDACLRHDVTDRASLIKVPALIMTGDDDPLVPPANSTILQGYLPQADLIVFQKRRHCFFIEVAEEFNQVVIDFLHK